ncbi:MAG: TM2 domain-containing protein [Muribaculaceae bacterium]|nr:TM2 domain-containing protein [Muribaculaceae bacterium]
MNADQIMAYPVSADTQVSKDGGPWTPLFNYPELMQLLSRQGGTGYGSYSGMSSMEQTEVSSKKTLCGIMAILFGWLGIQYFILGKVGGGFITILLTIVTCGLWELVTFIQGILMLCMSDSEFKRKFMDNTSTLPLF